MRCLTAQVISDVRTVSVWERFPDVRTTGAVGRGGARKVKAEVTAAVVMAGKELSAYSRARPVIETLASTTVAQRGRLTASQRPRQARSLAFVARSERVWRKPFAV